MYKNLAPPTTDPPEYFRHRPCSALNSGFMFLFYFSGVIWKGGRAHRRAPETLELQLLQKMVCRIDCSRDSTSIVYPNTKHLRI